MQEALYRLDNISNENTQQKFFQPKLAINQPCDAYEQEADTVAGNVMSMKDSSAGANFFSPPLVQRKCAHCGNEEKKAQRKENGSEIAKAPVQTEKYLSSLAGGKPLNNTERNFFESRMGYDFSQVQLHTDAKANQSAKGVNALAYTHGKNIVFGSAQYQPDTAEGKKLLAHELTHVVQQNNGLKSIQRKPASESFTDDIHGDLTGQFAQEENVPPEAGAQYSDDYAIWLAVKSGNNIQFTGTDIARQNPLDRMSNGLSTGFTDLIINNTRIQGGTTLGAQVAGLTQQLTPVNFSYKDFSNGQWSCRIAADFKIQSKAEITIPTAPANNGWSANVASNAFAAINNRAACANTGSVPVRLRGKPTDQTLNTVVEASEREHVNELQILHKRHLVPYYHYAMSLRGVGNSKTAAQADLMGKLKNRLDEAVYGFALADVAEARKFDRPGGTHQGNFNVTNWNSCNPVEMEFTTGANAQQPQLRPGNIQIVAPVSVNFNAASLTVQGTDIKNGAQTVRSFSTAQNAQVALAILQAYNATSYNRIGPFEYILVNGNAPAGAQANINELELKPGFYQVTIGIPNSNDWVISQMDGGNFLEIINFGNAINQAYAAIEVMRRFGFTHKCVAGGMMYFRVG